MPDMDGTHVSNQFMPLENYSNYFTLDSICRFCCCPSVIKINDFLYLSIYFVKFHLIQ